MISASRILKGILLFFGVAVLLMIIIFPDEVIKPEKVLKKENMILVSQVLDYTPSGMFVNYLRTIAKPLHAINLSFIISMTNSSGTSKPLSMKFLASNPNLVLKATFSLSMSPVAICGKPNFLLNFPATVPFPTPGGPNNIMFITFKGYLVL